MSDTVALANFRAALMLSSELITLESAIPDPPPPALLERSLGLRGGAAVLMVAAFEAYLRSGIAEMVRPLLGPPAVPIARLPKKLQIAAVFESLEKAMYAPRYGLPKGKYHRLPDIRTATTAVSTGQFSPDALAQTRSNPDPNTIIRLLTNLGIASPFTSLRPIFDTKWILPESVNFVADKLEEIIQRRHKVAHAADASGIARSSLAEASKFLLALSETIDEHLQLYIASI